MPAQQFLEGVGVNLHLHGENPDLVVQMLAKNGIANARIEIGWILLNSHQGVPCPVRMFSRKLTAAAEAGARQVEIDDASGLIVGRSGLSGLTDYWAAEGVITAIDDKRLSLSKPLPKPITAGAQVNMATVKYRPFSPPDSDDYRETLAGWKRYVATVVGW